MKTYKGFASIILLIIISIIIVGGTAYYFSKKKTEVPEQIACTMEAKLCPDGSSVDRQGPKCEFAACPQATATDQVVSWQTNDKFTGFDKIATYIKTKNPSVPILLPTQLPESLTLTWQLSQNESFDLYASADVKSNGYYVSIYYGKNCGANACFGAAFTAERGQALFTDGTEQVALANNIVGYYYPRSCGGSCSPQQITWLYQGVSYSIQLKSTDVKADIIAWANSAIQNAL